ncbi:MAG: HPr(Ser) kinase/phosphatase [Deltaproteobacteria bacterium]|nr:HPr(Ser) kinase/phosphatase [Deltaproteobacteria bacterium]
MDSLSIKDLIECGRERLGIKLVAGTSGITRDLMNLSIQIFDEESRASEKQLRHEEVIIIGQHDVAWLISLSENKRQDILQDILSAKIPLIILSNVLHIPDSLVHFSEQESVPLFTSNLNIFSLESRLVGLLREKIAHTVIINGVFVEVFGMGVIIVGDSGIGKSECGLELVTRGHKLIADDVIEIQKREDGMLSGYSIELTRYFMEIRGLGVINIKSLFGVAAVSDVADINIMVEFIKWEEGALFDRMGTEEQFYMIMGVKIPLIKAPVRSGGSMATIVEIVARNEILKKDNYLASRDLTDRINDKIKRESQGKD